MAVTMFRATCRLWISAIGPNGKLPSPSGRPRSKGWQGAATPEERDREKPYLFASPA